MDQNLYEKCVVLWLLSFHMDKCKYMRIRKTSIEDQSNQMEKQLKKITCEKDVGVIINDKLSCADHLAEKINKANKVVGLIRTFVAPDANMQIRYGVLTW